MYLKVILCFCSCNVKSTNFKFYVYNIISFLKNYLCGQGVISSDRTQASIYKILIQSVTQPGPSIRTLMVCTAGNGPVQGSLKTSNKIS